MVTASFCFPTIVLAQGYSSKQKIERTARPEPKKMLQPENVLEIAEIIDRRLRRARPKKPLSSCSERIRLK